MFLEPHELWYDVVIIGAGPAGLAAATRIGDQTNRFLILDSGKPLEERDRYLDVADGVAGAGLYSDGKHSFFPSATKLWRLRNLDLLKDAYEWTADVLSKNGLSNVPPFPSSLSIPASDSSDCSWELKAYPSGYLSLDSRMKLAGDLWKSLTGHLALSTRLVNWNWNERSELFDLEIESAARSEVIHSKFLIFSGGRLSPLEVLRISSQNFSSHIKGKFFRIEVGVRIEMEHTAEFFSLLKGVDPKYILRTEIDGYPLEFRTFCCCRRGEVVSSNCCGIVSVSGRADVSPTQKSNIGLNVRLLRFDQRIAADLFEKLQKCKEPFSISLSDALLHQNTHPTLISIYGEQLSGFLSFGLRKLSEKFPSLLRSAAEGKLIGPCIEGVGMYPDTDDDLRVIASDERSSKSRCFVAGDANGKFRGIVAALISGRYVASCIAQELRQLESSHSPVSKL